MGKARETSKCTRDQCVHADSGNGSQQRKRGNSFQHSIKKMSGQYIINFRMPGYRLFLERFGIDINVMIRAMPVETTSGVMQLPNQFRSLQSATSFM
jgi:hypothetical protein